MKMIFTLLGIVFMCGGMNIELNAGQEPKYEKATFAGGCFWCVQQPFEPLKGIKSALAGYANGNGKMVTYKNYAQNNYVEAVQVEFDSSLISYSTLLDVFWRQFNPTDAGGQFNDRGPQYRSAIFYHTDAQKRIAEESKTALGASGRFDKPIVTEITKFTNFYPAEEYHQHYHDKNPIRYKYYRYRSGRDEFLNKIWSKQLKSTEQQKYFKPSDAELKKRLTPLQYEVTQRGGTEPAHNNIYWNNWRPGIYVDIVSGEPLFSSLDKYDAKTGWPSFSRVMVPEHVIEGPDKGVFTSYREVRSRYANSHLGDLFYDGPKPTGRRYCLDSAALRFIPVEDLEKEGYAEFKAQFEKGS